MRQRARAPHASPPAWRPLAAAATAALLLLALAPAASAAHAAAPSQQLPDAVLHKLLYEEPNAQLRALGNVRHLWLLMCDCLS